MSVYWKLLIKCMRAKIKLLLLCIAAIVAGLLFFVITSRPVTKFGPLKLGQQSPFGPGDGASFPYQVVPSSTFYIFSAYKGLPTDCVFEECGMSGLLVECVGGWLSGAGVPEYTDMLGLNEEAVARGDSMVIVADKDLKIVGIYPGYTINNIPTILKKHKNLFEPKALEWCFDHHMPKWRWR